MHEQQPQPLGCDRRLLSLVRLLQDEGRHVSLLYRHDVPAAEQAPPTAQLAELLGVSPFDPAHLSGCLRPPPALYLYAGNTRQIERLAERGWFGMLLVTVWFWNDPLPSFAELTLPVFRAHTPHMNAQRVVVVMRPAAPQHHQPCPWPSRAWRPCASCCCCDHAALLLRALSSCGLPQ